MNCIWIFGTPVLLFWLFMVLFKVNHASSEKKNELQIKKSTYY